SQANTCGFFKEQFSNTFNQIGCKEHAQPHSRAILFHEYWREKNIERTMRKRSFHKMRQNLGAAVIDIRFQQIEILRRLRRFSDEDAEDVRMIGDFAFAGAHSNCVKFHFGKWSALLNKMLKQ